MNKYCVSENDYAEVFNENNTMDVRTNTKNLKKILETENLIENLNNIRNNIIERLDDSVYENKYSKVIGSVLTSLYGIINISSLLIDPDSFILVLLLSSVFVGNVGIIEIINANKSKRSMKNLSNKLRYYDNEYINANKTLVDLIKNDEIVVTDSHEREVNVMDNEAIHDLCRRSTLDDKYLQNEEKYFKKYKDGSLVKYLENKGYSEKDIDLFFQILLDDIKYKEDRMNEEIPNVNYNLRLTNKFDKQN